jgi:hypothetical protein
MKYSRLILIWFIFYLPAVHAQFQLDFSVIIDRDDFQLSPDYKLRVGSSSYPVYIGSDDSIWIHTSWRKTNSIGLYQWSWYSSTGELLWQIIRHDKSGDNISMSSDDFLPCWISNDISIVKMGGGFSVLDRNKESGEVAQEPFAFKGKILSTNTKRLHVPYSPIGDPIANHIYSVELSESSLTLNRISLSIAKTALKLEISKSADNVIVATNIGLNEDYILQSSKNLEDWKNERAIIGDGQKHSFELPTDKIMEFLRVVPD